MLSRQWLVRNHGLRVLALTLATEGAACIPPETSLSSADAQANDSADVQTSDSADAQANDDCPLTSPDACDVCCTSHHEGGASTFNLAWYSCVCTISNCQNQCATTDCSNNNDAGAPETGDPCDNCENMVAPWAGGGACGSTIASTCNQSSDCMAYYRCEQQCP